MDKSAIRNFAIEARKMLMKSAETEAGFYGVTKNGCKSPIQKGNDFEVYETIAGTENRIYGADIKRRANLVMAVETLGFEQVMEETAYTWFNRIIAIRFMEVNDYLPARVRVLSSEIGSNTPDIVTQFLDIDLNMTPEELEKVQKAKDENRYDDAFRILFIKQCNELNAILPGLFEKTDDYMELLLKLSYTSDGVVRMLIDSINENNFNVDTEGQVEIIGWMYQYYNTELKDDTFAKLKKNVKITKERIPAATQLFTPDWIVRYMVENSVGRVWIEHLRAVNPSIDEKEKAEEFGWKYYLPEAEQEDSVAEKLAEIRKDYAGLEPKDITCIDPCMGSGHILVYMFDVLMDIYRSEGFSERDAVFSILENNIRGLDIDKRAYQLSYFALMMKAREYNRTFFRGKQDEEGNRCFVEPMVLAVEESNTVNLGQLKYFGANFDGIKRNNAINQMQGLLESLKDAKEYGSILMVDNYDWELLLEFADSENTDGQISFDTLGIELTQRQMKRLICQGRIMSNKYCVVSTNPPYMGANGMGNKLSGYCKSNYPNSKTDLYSVFIEKCKRMTKENFYQSMITQQSWMFLGSFTKLREIVLENLIVNMAHLGARAFDEISGEVVQTTAFVLKKTCGVDKYRAVFRKLIEASSEKSKMELFLTNANSHSMDMKSMKNIPEMPIAYWLNEHMVRTFDNDKLYDIATTRQGFATGNNDKYLRYWTEVDYIKLGRKWFSCNKGGTYRKWYGNNIIVANWENDGFEMRNEKGSVIRNSDYYFKEGLTWSSLGNNFGVRYSSADFLFESKGSMCFVYDRRYLLYILGLLNSAISKRYLEVLAPTLDFHEGPVSRIPVIISKEYLEEVNALVSECIGIAKDDWNSYEMSMNFKKHPFMMYLDSTKCIKEAFELWKKDKNEKQERMLQNERRLDEIFMDIYGINDMEIMEDITLYAVDSNKDVKSFVSYAVGCIFGRYSLDDDGVVHAGGEFNKDKYLKFAPDKDAIIPITDADYFGDDIVSEFERFVLCAWGKEKHEENMRFISQELETKGETVREKIRTYFKDEFFKNHCDTYAVSGSGKRPIYWLFDSGKQNGFKCLIYMHRYNKDTLNLIRSEYLHKTQNAVENALKNAEYIIQTSASAVERAKATKDRDRYVKQLNEMRIYYQALSHLALQKIEIDLDDGVKHNYQLFQNIEVIVDGGKKQKVDLLAKI